MQNLNRTEDDYNRILTELNEIENSIGGKPDKPKQKAPLTFDQQKQKENKKKEQQWNKKI